MAICSVKNCPADAQRGYKTCAPHRKGRLARDMGIRLGDQGEHCVRCRRAFKADDFVLLDSVATTRHRKAVRGHEHVACGPKRIHASLKKQRDAVKPLLADL